MHQPKTVSVNPPQNIPKLKINTISSFQLSNQFNLTMSPFFSFPIPFIIIATKITRIAIDIGIKNGVAPFVVSANPFAICIP